MTQLQKNGSLKFIVYIESNKYLILHKIFILKHNTACKNAFFASASESIQNRKHSVPSHPQSSWSHFQQGDDQPQNKQCKIDYIIGIGLLAS
jgi:hypothetical protein